MSRQSERRRRQWMNSPFAARVEAPFGGRTEVTLRCGRALHRVILRRGQVHFCHHRLVDLEFANALDTAPTHGCAWVLRVLRSHDPVTLATLPPFYLNGLGYPDLCRVQRNRAHVAQPTPGPDALLKAAWTRRFQPLEAALQEEAGLAVEIKIHRNRPFAAVTLFAVAGGRLGVSRGGSWHLSRRAVATAARALTPTGAPIAFWGEGTCRVCNRPAVRSGAEAPRTSTWDPRSEWIEEIPVPTKRHEGIAEHARSQRHLDRIVTALDEILGPGCFLESRVAALPDPVETPEKESQVPRTPEDPRTLAGRCP